MRLLDYAIGLRDAWRRRHPQVFAFWTQSLDTPKAGRPSLFNNSATLERFKTMIPYKDVYKNIAPKEVIVGTGVAGGKAAAAGGTPTIEGMKAAAYSFVVEQATANLRAVVADLLENAVAEFEMTEGERPSGAADNSPSVDEWRDKFDAFLIARFSADEQRAIGPSALGEHFTDSDIDNAEVRAKVVNELAARLAEAAQPMDNANTTEARRSINKTLSAAGVVEADFAEYAGAPGAGKEAAAAVIDEAQARGRVEAVVGAYALREGADKFDPLVLAETLESAFDEDHFIAVGGVERLGGKVADVPYFKAYKLALPLEAVGNTMNAALAALASGAVVEQPKETKPKKTKITKGAAAANLPAAAASPAAPAAPLPPTAAPPAAPSGGAAGTDYGDVVRLWAQYGCDSSTDIAAAIDVSRGTVSNIVNKGTKLPLTVEQRQAVKALLTNRVKGLQEAVAKL